MVACEADIDLVPPAASAGNLDCVSQGEASKSRYTGTMLTLAFGFIAGSIGQKGE
jgi:hypothetical protein